MIQKISHYIKDEVWSLEEQDLTGSQILMNKTLRIFLLSSQGFVKDLCLLRASALTLYTLLSIVPIIALLFGVAKGFGFEQNLKERLLEQSAEQNAVMLQIIEFAENMLINTKGGIVAGVGVAILFWTVIKVLGNIEESFNYIWKIKQARTLPRKFSDYLSIMMLAPILLIASSSITVFVKTQITWLLTVIQLPEFGARLVLFALSFSPVILMMLLFSFIFIFMPNRKINFKAGLLAGLISAVAFQLAQWAYLTLQIGASSYNAIYGSFAALPLFLIWLQIVWFIVLFGCEISFYIQNYASYQHNDRFSGLSNKAKKVIALQLMHLLIYGFVRGDKTLTAEKIADNLKLPLVVVQDTLGVLLDSKLIVELKVEDEENKLYFPAYDIHVLTVASVIDALEKVGVNDIEAGKNAGQFNNITQDWMNLLMNSDRNVLLKDI